MATFAGEYTISAIEITDGGSGYNCDQPPRVAIAPPPTISYSGALSSSSSSSSDAAGGSDEPSERPNAERQVGDKLQADRRQVDARAEARAPRVSARLSARAGALTSLELRSIGQTLQQAASGPRTPTYVGPATPPPTMVGLPLQPSRPGLLVEMLPDKARISQSVSQSVSQ